MHTTQQEDAMSKIVNFQKQADILFQLTPAHLEMVVNIEEERSLSAKELILAEGANSKQMYIIIQGDVDVLVNPALVGVPCVQ